MQDRIDNRAYGTVSPDKQREMSGWEFVSGLANGTLPLNTIARTLRYDVVEAEKGRVVATVEPGDIHLNPAGTVHGGLAATLLDSCMGLPSSRSWGKGSARRRWSSRFRSSGRSRSASARSERKASC